MIWNILETESLFHDWLFILCSVVLEEALAYPALYENQKELSSQY